MSPRGRHANVSAVLAPERCQVHHGSQGLAEGLWESAGEAGVSPVARVSSWDGGQVEGRNEYGKEFGVGGLKWSGICPHLDSQPGSSQPLPRQWPLTMSPTRAGTNSKACRAPLPKALSS